MATKKANELIRAELAYQEAQDTEIINDELQRSGAEPLPQVDQSEINETMHAAEALDVPVEETTALLGSLSGSLESSCWKLNCVSIVMMATTIMMMKRTGRMLIMIR